MEKEMEKEKNNLYLIIIKKLNSKENIRKEKDMEKEQNMNMVH